MKNAILAQYEAKKYADKKSLPKFRPGDTVRVHYKVQEGSDKNKFRIQVYEGVVIRFKKGEINGTFTVRKMGANSVGVERVFPVVSPNIEKVDVIAAGIVRRSRLFYLRERSGKSARIKSRYIGVAKSGTKTKKRGKKAKAERAAAAAAAAEGKS